MDLSSYWICHVFFLWDFILQIRDKPVWLERLLTEDNFLVKHRLFPGFSLRKSFLILKSIVSFLDLSNSSELIPEPYLYQSLKSNIAINTLQNRPKSNYRPVSLTSINSRYSIVFLRGVMHGHLEINRLISIEQHGFISSKACVTNLLKCLDLTSNALHKHRKLDVLYQKLIHKLRAYGFGCKLIDWFSAFLIGRKQRVVIAENTLPSQQNGDPVERFAERDCTCTLG